MQNKISNGFERRLNDELELMRSRFQIDCDNSNKSIKETYEMQINFLKEVKNNSEKEAAQLKQKLE